MAVDQVGWKFSSYSANKYQTENKFFHFFQFAEHPPHISSPNLSLSCCDFFLHQRKHWWSWFKNIPTTVHTGSEYAAKFPQHCQACRKCWISFQPVSTRRGSSWVLVLQSTLSGLLVHCLIDIALLNRARNFVFDLKLLCWWHRWTLFGGERCVAREGRTGDKGGSLTPPYANTFGSIACHSFHLESNLLKSNPHMQLSPHFWTNELLRALAPPHMIDSRGSLINCQPVIIRELIFFDWGPDLMICNNTDQVLQWKSNALAF